MHALAQSDTHMCVMYFDSSTYALVSNLHAALCADVRYQGQINCQQLLPSNPACRLCKKQQQQQQPLAWHGKSKLSWAINSWDDNHNN
jgi:hypothetical protein